MDKDVPVKNKNIEGSIEGYYVDEHLYCDTSYVIRNAEGLQVRWEKLVYDTVEEALLALYTYLPNADLIPGKNIWD
jgi:hypothetical protein